MNKIRIELIQLSEDNLFDTELELQIQWRRGAK